MDFPLLKQLAWPTGLFLIALIIRAIFAFLETAITSLRLFKLKEFAQTVSKHQALFAALEKNPHRILVTILIASSTADVTCAALATTITERLFSFLNLSSGLGFTVGIGFASIAIIVFGEIIPKNLAKSHSDRIFKSMLWLISLVYHIFYPLVTVLMRFSDAVVFNIHGKRLLTSDGQWITSEREIQFLIDYIHDKGLIEPEKTEMLNNIFDLGTKPVKEIMVPATDIIMVSIDTEISKVLEVFSEHQFTRMPIYKETPENILGMVHQKDIFLMLSQKQNKPLDQLIRPIMFIPESVKISQLLNEFKDQHMHIAIVLNEHGGVTGLITLEDVLEEIVGEISDEHEPATEKIIELQQGGYLVDASTTLEELEEFLGIPFESEGSVTLGGFLTEQLKHLPKKGERILYKKYYLQVQQASEKRVQQVLVFERKEPHNIDELEETSKEE